MALASIESPRRLPEIVWLAVARGAFPLDLIRLMPYRAWLRQLRIGTVIDVGAHSGEFASAIGALLPSARLYCFEPLPDAFQKLTRRFQHRQGFEAFRVALGAQPGRMALHRSAFAKASSLLPMGDLHRTAFPWVGGSTSVDVEMHELDAYVGRLTILPRVLLKIDVQGYEDRVLAGAGGLLRLVDVAIIETSFAPLYESQAYFRDIYARLLEAGFEFRGDIGQLRSPLDGTILQADSVFVRV